MSRDVSIGLIQMRCSDDVQSNFDRTVKQIRSAALQGAQIICTQELFQTRYFPQVEASANFALAERLDKGSSTLANLRALSRELKIILIASLFEERATGLYHNTAVLIDDAGQVLGKYRKMHIPDDPQYYEKFYFTPGDLGYPVFKTKHADISVLICWDQWFPEAARMCALKGAEIIFYPTAIGYSLPEERNTAYRDAWTIVQQGHAVANACYVACINRVGYEPNPASGPGIDFWGRSFVADPYGQVVTQASDVQEELLVTSLDLAVGEELKKGFSFPFRDRRIDSYRGLTKLFLDSES
jgi:N-carbamoylputrescine amidase